MKNIISNISQSEKNRILEMHRSATRKNYLFEQALPLPNKFSDYKAGAYFNLLQSGNWDQAEASNNFPFSAGTYTLTPATDDPLGSSAFLVDSKGQFTGYLLFFKQPQKTKPLPTQLTIDENGSPDLPNDSWQEVKYVAEIANNTYPKIPLNQRTGIR
jgi:hypothetical protein